MDFTGQIRRSHQKRLVVFSGAGLSADSGISTFRGEDGTWASHSLDEVCNIHSWKRNFDLVHRFYNDLRTGLQTVQPNAMHKLLADWQRRFGAELITQNIDNLLERSGAENVLHLHGSLPEMKCEACGRIWQIGLREWDQDRERCTCNSRKGVKPNAIFFGETAPAYLQLRKTMKTLKRDDVLVVIGTDGAVVPIGSFAAEAPCRTVINTLAPVPAERWRPGMVKPEMFDRTVYRRAVEAVDDIDEIVTAWMKASPVEKTFTEESKNDHE
ncbi:SIR2 family NAD-dependent protein deacylase [Leisingera caerulea]|uniref:SIR2 family NAD-dependent protein deacylase n=1 Tax=Leisingera caerulea TaxID=506591 RepID=UPI0013780961|nr:Sir2 family NAD-dependent protein deacetylase [Leisingera caerulea]